MMNKMNFEAIALAHQEKYPLMQAQDFVKLAYQSAFGCGHMVSDFESALARIQAEQTGERVNAFTEDIGNGYVRLHLNGGNAPVSDEAAARMFFLSACPPLSGADEFTALSRILLSLARARKIAPGEDEIRRALSPFENGCFSPVSHTSVYREAYRPAYRVIKACYAQHLSLISRLDQIKAEKPGAIAAIDGMCAGGKTTLAALLSGIWDAPVLHMDDFFLPPAKRTPERLAQAGGNVDYERFLSEVLTPLLGRTPFSYRPFDCSTMDFAPPVFCEGGPLTIVEGSYACHPTLTHAYDFRIFVSVDPQTQEKRILARNGEKMLMRFISEWIPMENRYFKAFRIQEKADVTIRTSEA